MTVALVTGLGVTAPNGLGTEEFWRATVAGTGGIGPLTRFNPVGYPCTLAGEVPGFVPKEHIPGRLLAQTDHMTRLAMTAAAWAVDDAGINASTVGEFDVGVITANGFGGFEFGQRELEKLWSRGPGHVSAYQSFAWFYAVNTGQISIRHGLRGPSGVVVTEQAGGLDAIAQARRQLRRGVRMVVTGGVDGALCPWGWTALLAGGQLTTVEDPARAFLPFDSAASGQVPGEGGAIMVLEDARSARERPAPKVYGEIAGYAAAFDPRPDAEHATGLRRVVVGALADAAVSPADVDVVFADGAAIPELDRIEAAAITAIFGVRGVPVTVPKTMVGRLASGGSALDLAAALLSIRDGVIPPTTNVTAPAPGLDVDLVTDARARHVDVALVLARGYGGFNAAAVVRRASADAR